MKNNPAEGKPFPNFSILSAIAVMAGVVIGIGIFRLPSIIASSASSSADFILFWILGGAVSLLGAFCYAELAAAHPNAGGEYHFLHEAFGPSTAFLFAWGRMTVIQTGSIALAAFILGDYASLLFNLGTYSSAIYAGSTVVLLTALNILGTAHSKKAQNIVTLFIVFALVAMAFMGSVNGSAAKLSLNEAFSTPQSGFGGAMIFALLTYGGWNEAVYLSAEIKDVRKNIATVLIAGIGIITTIYVAVNYAYLNVLGLSELQNAETVGVTFIEQLTGGSGSLIIACIVIFAALSTANATIITGARTNYALGRDFSVLHFLGHWDARRNSPQNALIIQGAITLFLIILGAFTQEAVSTMVDYTAPVFWFFLLLTTATLFIFRQSDSAELPYKVPLYPLTPLLFMAVCSYMLYSSVAFTGSGAIFGIGILIFGVPVLWWHKKRTHTQHNRY